MWRAFQMATRPTSATTRSSISTITPMSSTSTSWPSTPNCDRRCPVAWNENYGGFWFLTSYDAVSQTAADGDTFAHKYEPNADRRRRLPGRDGRPAPRRPSRPGHRRDRRPLPPSPPTRAGPVLLPRRRRKLKPFMEAISPLVPRPDKSPQDTWTWCSTTPARSRPS